MKKVLEKRKDIAFYIILFPLPMHQDAARKSKAILCEKSLQLLEDAFEKKQIPDPKCNTTAVEDNIKLGQRLGVSGTPAVIFPDGTKVPGAMSAEDIIKKIDKN